MGFLASLPFIPAARIPFLAQPGFMPFALNFVHPVLMWALLPLHVAINVVLLLFGWQAVSGIAIVQKLLTSGTSPAFTNA
ncbi:hypothetical protein [Cyanobium sp. ATX 6A2]|uniref:hypothetical protein n=1 Tax=Cyanobium sp. ATX 6A2 TaxID=2823700 RepID=UPI0020CE6846|nr:hypothetical protein [Cyanobium sp. ATX 6A2]